MSTEWRQLVFSNESRFMLHRADGRWLIQHVTSESKHPATVAGMVYAGEFLVWGIFSFHSLRSLIIVEATMDQYKYASDLLDHVHLNMVIVFPQNGVFEQDNVKCNTAGSVHVWFEVQPG
ncbi:transposable element Tcb1 transposase [Trichonephila clavipes]|nr:transposable element Tcb1 transposase [Trichonephila clavipes]